MNIVRVAKSVGQAQGLSFMILGIVGILGLIIDMERTIRHLEKGGLGWIWSDIMMLLFSLMMMALGGLAFYVVSQCTKEGERRSSKQRRTNMVELRAKTSTAEIVGTAVAMLLSMYILLGTPVWLVLMDGKMPAHPGLLYEPVVKMLR